MTVTPETVLAVVDVPVLTEPLVLVKATAPKHRTMTKFMPRKDNNMKTTVCKCNARYSA